MSRKETEYVSITQCAALKGVTRQAVHFAIDRDVFEGAKKIGTQWAIPKSECEKWQPDESFKALGEKGAEKRWAKRPAPTPPRAPETEE